MEMHNVTGLDSVRPEGDQPPRIQRLKRPRVKMACQRCKSRKQKVERANPLHPFLFQVSRLTILRSLANLPKCDGKQPECSNCGRLDLNCVYKASLSSKPQEVRVHVEALENRIAELEMTLTANGLSEDAVDHWRQSHGRRFDGEDSDGAEGPSLAAVRDVSLNIHGSFMGDTSTIALARMLECILSKGKERLAFHEATYTFSPNETSPESHEDTFPMYPEYRSSLDNRLGNAPPPDLIRGMQGHIADKLLQGYFDTVATNYPVLHSVQIKNLHHNRENLVSPYELSIMNLIYGLGGQYLEMVCFLICIRITCDNSYSLCQVLLIVIQTGQLPYQQWRYHYELALEERYKIIRLGNTQTLAYLLLIIQQCLRIPRDPGGWTFIGVAMRICVELGLHRKKRQYLKPNLQSELEKRQFWACYYVDRDLALSLGRPPSINDCDIDVEVRLMMFHLFPRTF
jgi:hypothetical protein